MVEADSKPQTSPPLTLHAKPRSAVTTRLVNGHSPLSKASDSSSSTVTRADERDKLLSSIRATYDRRVPVGQDPITTNGYDSPGYEDDIDEEDPTINFRHESIVPDNDDLALIAEPPKDKRKKIYTSPPIGTTRSGSPFTMMPPIDFDGLSWPSIGTRARLEQTPEQAQERIAKLAAAVRTILECLGEDPEREGLSATPERYAKALLFFTKGYTQDLKSIVNQAIFIEDHDEMVIVKDIEIHSLCEHHLVPWFGRLSVGYIPNQRVLGLSKLARIAEMFSRRLQVQEKLTKQVALAIDEVLQPQGVAVVVESTHMCMVMRGVQKSGSTTTTSCMRGAMRSSSKTREEFLSLLNRR